MEAVGSIASIITLIESTGALAKRSKSLVSRWRNAPCEIEALSMRLSLLAAELQSIKNATSKSHPILTDAIIRQSLQNLLREAHNRLRKLESLCLRLEKQHPLRRNMQWACLEAASAEKMLGKAHEMEQSLANLMILVSLRAQTPTMNSLERIEHMVTALTATVSSYASTTSTLPPILAADVIRLARSKILTKHVIATSPWTSSQKWQDWGFRMSRLTTTRGHDTDRIWHISISLPLTRIVGRYALNIGLLLRSTYSCRNTISIRHPSYFAVSRIVDDNHPFIVACALGDLSVVRAMLQSGEGRLTDATSTGDTPMKYAACHGQKEVVAELIDSGVDIDAAVDSDMFTALEVATAFKRVGVVRLLLAVGASQEHRNMANCSAAMLCWYSHNDEHEALPIDIFNILSEHALQDLATANVDGRTALHIASEHVDALQVAALVNLGGDVHHLDICGYAAINDATFYGNYDGFSALALQYNKDTTKGLRSIALSPLHSVIAGKDLYLKMEAQQRIRSTKIGRRIIITGRPFIGKAYRVSEINHAFRRHGNHDLIMKKILRDGLDIEARGHFLDQFMQPNIERGWNLPRELMGREVTALELAATYGPATEAWYLNMLHSCGLLRTVTDVRRLRELNKSGHGVTGWVCETEDGADEAFVDTERNSESSVDQMDFLQQDIGGPSRTCVGDESSSVHSEVDEVEHFYDAEETLC